MAKHEDYENKTKELIADILKDAGVALYDVAFEKNKPFVGALFAIISYLCPQNNDKDNGNHYSFARRHTRSRPAVHRADAGAHRLRLLRKDGGWKDHFHQGALPGAGRAGCHHLAHLRHRERIRHRRGRCHLPFRLLPHQAHRGGLRPGLRGLLLQRLALPHRVARTDRELVARRCRARGHYGAGRR